MIEGSQFWFLACAMTHLAWTGEMRERNGQYYAQVESWAYGSAPLPSEFPLWHRSQGDPPPPDLNGQLAVLQFENGKWTLLASLPASEASAMIALASKISVAGSVIRIAVTGAKGVPVTLTVETSGREHRRLVTSGSEAEFLGLPPGVYTVKGHAQGFRQVGESSVQVTRCGETRVVLERYGWREWAAEEFAPVISLARATWMLASEYVQQRQ